METKNRHGLSSSALAMLAIRLRGLILGAACIAAAFGVGLTIGHLPATEAVKAPAAPEVASHFATSQQAPGKSSAEKSATASVAERVENGRLTLMQRESGTATRQAASQKLRVRSTALVSSSEAKAGDSILFVTEHQVENLRGQRIPAGSIVEGIVSRADKSTTRNPGSLVIEIRALHVGSKAIPIHALPYTSTPQVPDSTIPAPGSGSEIARESKPLRIRTLLRINPEAIVPREGIIEFELVDAKPDSGDPSGAAPEPSSLPRFSAPDAPFREIAPPRRELPENTPRRAKVPVSSV